MNRADLISRLEEASEGSQNPFRSSHEVGYRAFQQRGLSARNPFFAEPHASMWDAGFQKAKRDLSKAIPTPSDTQPGTPQGVNPNNPGEPQ